MSQAAARIYDIFPSGQDRGKPVDVLGALLGPVSGNGPRQAAKPLSGGGRAEAPSPAPPRKPSRSRAKKTRRAVCYLTREEAERLGRAKAAIGRRAPRVSAHKISKSGIMALCLDMLLRDHERRGRDSVLSRACLAHAAGKGK